MAPPIQSERPLREYLRPVRARKGVILLAMALVPAAALVASSRQTTTYEATARVFLGQGAVPGDVGAQLWGSFNAPERAVTTQARLAHSPSVAARVLAAVPAEGRSVRGLLQDSSVTAQPGGDILAFSVRDRDGRLAQRLATEYARQYTLYRRRLDRLPIEQALAELRAARGSGSRTGAARQARELQTLQAGTGAGAPVVDPASSAAKTRPQTARNVVAGLLLGTVFGLGLVFLWEALDTRVRSSAEISDGLGLPELARVPAGARRFGSDSLPVMLTEPQSREAEAFRFLRTNVQFGGLERRARTIMVTSAHAGEGKSSVSANLAVALARAGRDVTLIDLDLRKPSLARCFRLHGRPGLTDVALGSATLDEALATIPTHVSGEGVPEGTLRVLASGPPPPDAGEFHTTLALESILDEVRRTSDLVIVDSPPLLGVGDAVTLAGKVDAILLVARRGVLRRPMLAELRRFLAGSPAQKLGFVLTGARFERRLAGDGRSSKPAAGRALGFLEGKPS